MEMLTMVCHCIEQPRGVFVGGGCLLGIPVYHVMCVSCDISCDLLNVSPM